jgi:hypothetical protein
MIDLTQLLFIYKQHQRLPSLSLAPTLSLSSAFGSSFDFEEEETNSGAIKLEMNLTTLDTLITSLDSRAGERKSEREMEDYSICYSGYVMLRLINVKAFNKFFLLLRSPSQATLTLSIHESEMKDRERSLCKVFLAIKATMTTEDLH